MIKAQKPANRLESIQDTLISVKGMLELMKNDGSIPFAWQSQVALKQNMCEVAVLDVIELRRKDSSTNNGETNNGVELDSDQTSGVDAPRSLQH